jgi:hypothetical protein
MWLSMAASGGGLPKQFGNWHTIYTRMNCWSKVGVMDRVFEKLQLEQIVRINGWSAGDALRLCIVIAARAEQV